VDKPAQPPFELAVPTVGSGSRASLPRPPGSGDALLVAQLAGRARGQAQLLVVACADALDAQRLTEEITYFDPRLAVRQFPDWETLPYDILSPHQDLVSERLAALHGLLARDAPGALDVLVVAATTALGRLAPPSYVGGHTFFFRQGQRLAAEALRSRLIQAGYQHVSQVVAPGEFSVRGGLIDLFPMGAVLPFRLDLNDDVIETIRSFDADSQRSLYPVPEVRLLPGREFPLDEASRVAFRGRWRETFEGDPSRCTVYRDIGQGIAGAGIEYYLPLFFEETGTLFDYLPDDSLLVLHGPIEAAAQRFWTETSERYRFLSRDTQRPCLPPGRLFLTPEEFFVAARPFARLALGEGGQSQFAPLPALAVQRKAADPLQHLREFAAAFGADGGRVLLAADSAGRRETIAHMLREYELPFGDNADFSGFLAGDTPLALGVAPLHGGFVLPQARLALITETELYETSPRRSRARHRERTSNV
jgi:transcription-repair coupling factor (superfamily II helicase)